MIIAFVSGATGIVGHSIVMALIKRGRRVRALVRSPQQARRNVPQACDVAQGNITDKESLRQAIYGCSSADHAAGLPEQWLPNPPRFHEVNVAGTHNSIDVAVEQSIERFVYTSTIDVFKGAKGRRFDESVLDDQPKATGYEHSKQAADKRVAAAIQTGLPAVFIHPSAG